MLKWGQSWCAMTAYVTLGLYLGLGVFGCFAQEVSPDRMVAEWALRLKGTVVLEGQTRPISEITELPASDFQIHTLNLVGMTFWANGLQDELSRLPELPH